MRLMNILNSNCVGGYANPSFVIPSKEWRKSHSSLRLPGKGSATSNWALMGGMSHIVPYHRHVFNLSQSKFRELATVAVLSGANAVLFHCCRLEAKAGMSVVMCISGVGLVEQNDTINHEDIYN